MTKPDQWTGTCVICEVPTDGDFCAACVEAGEDSDNFGRCYQCRDYHDHESCVGVPCQCPCPAPDQVARERAREAVLSKLTPHERGILGF